jgi:NADPH:quinone reductase-like Zn-dependent oxidoreductase
LKAVLLREFGGPEKLEFSDAPEPKPGPGEVVVRVRACGLNHLDLWIRSGIPAYKTSTPHVLGSDVAGTIAALGPGVEGWSVGQKTVVAPGVSCFSCDYCLSGRDHLCEKYGILGASLWGGYAEFVKAPARNLLPYPEALTFEQAASYPLAYLTAWHMLAGLAGLKNGDSALIIGGGSGVSTAGVQIAKLLGARVLVATRSAEKAAAAKALGADEAVVAPPAELHRAALKWTDGRGVDVVLEHVGPAVFEKAIKSLKRGGTLVSCGSTTGPVVSLDMRYVFSRELKILGAEMGPLVEMRRVARLVAEGRLKPAVDSVFELSQARRAHERLAEGKHFGKVVLSVP